MPSRRILVLAPHPDDEIVACGIAARRARLAGARIFVLFLTTGIPEPEALWPWQRGGYAARVARRREEARSAAALIGEPIGFLDYPSRRLRHHLDAAAAEAGRAIAEYAASELWVPAFEGAHQDHDAANALAAQFCDLLPVYEFAAYNFAGARVRSNQFPDRHDGEVTIELTPDEATLKQRALAGYASERRNLRHVRTARESWRPLPGHDHGMPPHAGRLFRERFHWVPFRHPRIDFEPSAAVYAEIGRWASGGAARLRLSRISASPGPVGAPISHKVSHTSAACPSQLVKWSDNDHARAARLSASSANAAPSRCNIPASRRCPIRALHASSAASRRRRTSISQLNTAKSGTDRAAIAAGHHAAALSRASSTKPSSVNRICAKRLRLKSTATEAAPRAGESRRRCSRRARTTSPPICAAGKVVLIDSAIQRSGSISAKLGRPRRGNRHAQAPQSTTTVAPRTATIARNPQPIRGKTPNNAAGSEASTSQTRIARPSGRPIRRRMRFTSGGRDEFGDQAVLGYMYPN